MNCTFEVNNIEIVSNHKAAGGHYRYQSTTSKFSTYGTDRAKSLLSLCPCNLQNDVSGCDHMLPPGSFRDQTQRATIDCPRTAEGYCVFYCLNLEEPKIQTFSLFSFFKYLFCCRYVRHNQKLKVHYVVSGKTFLPEEKDLSEVWISSPKLNWTPLNFYGSRNNWARKQMWTHF